MQKYKGRHDAESNSCDSKGMNRVRFRSEFSQVFLVLLKLCPKKVEDNSIE